MHIVPRAQIATNLPGAPDQFLDQIREASFDLRLWDGVTATLAAATPEGGCDIAFHPRFANTPVIRLNGWSALNGGTAPIAAIEEAGGRATLTLAEGASGNWKIRLWSRQMASDALSGLLRAQGAELKAAFATALALRAAAPPDVVRLGDLWDPLDFGVMLTEPFCRLRFANTAASDILASRALFRPTSAEGALRPALKENFAAFTQACEMMFEGAGERASFDMLGSRGEAVAAVTFLALRADGFGLPMPSGADRGVRRLAVTIRLHDGDAID